MSIRNAGACLTICLVLAHQAFSESAKQVCPAGTIALTVTFDDSYSSTLNYELTDPKAYSSAQIEVWDRPTLLFRTQVPVEPRGRFVWTPKEELADTPLALWILVDTNDSRVMIGTIGPVEGGPVPELIPQTMVLAERDESPEVTLKGRNFGEHNALVLLSEEESPDVWIAREYQPAAMADLGHISVQIPSAYLLKPTLLRLEAVRVGDESGRPLGSQVAPGFQSANIYVMDKSRPVFSGVEPSTVSANDQAGAKLRIWGNGFTTDSQVLTSVAGGIGHDSYPLSPVFVSSNELQLTVPSDLLRSASSSLYEDFQLWVRNGDDQHISDPRSLTLLPTSEFPLAGAKSPSISSVSPYPVPLMDRRSSANMLLKIYGDNFKKSDTVIVENGEPKGFGKLQTEFISSQQLNAWLPREMWRHHQLSFRLVAKASSGSCAAEVWEEQ